MKLHIIAIGRLRAGAQKQSVDDYLNRLKDTGRAQGVTTVTLREVEAKPAPTPALTIAREAASLGAALPEKGILVALDERGKTLSSSEFAEQLARWRDQGAPNVSFVIGGAGGARPRVPRPV